MIGLFIGRFQPFHLGHLKAIFWICERVELLYIIISESHNNNSEANPFSRSEREQMISRSLDAEGISHYKLVYVPDFATVDEWFAAIRNQAPDFDVVFTGNPWVEDCFSQRGFSVQHQPLFQPKRFSATRIRQMIKENKKWQELVPRAAEEVIESACQEQRQQRAKDQ